MKKYSDLLSLSVGEEMLDAVLNREGFARCPGQPYTEKMAIVVLVPFFTYFRNFTLLSFIHLVIETYKRYKKTYNNVTE